MENSGINVYKFALFKNHSDLVHGIFARSGGTSTGAFASLNIGLNSGDIELAVENNRKLIKREIGVQSLTFLNQVHGAKIRILKKSNNDLVHANQFNQANKLGKKAYTADGIITDIKDVSLVIQVADCQAIILYDHKKKVIANIHSGWQGSVKNIIGECLNQMISQFCCNPENIIAGISPSLGTCCSEFINYKEEIPQDLWNYKIKGKDYFDFWQISCDQLMEKGVKKENIENMKICTKCNMDKFYSYRGEKTTGRFACVISMI